MEIHIGTEIKKTLEVRGLSVTEFARRINKSRENAYSIFSRKSIDTDLLLKISDVLNHDFFLLYSTGYQVKEDEVQRILEENRLLKEYNQLLKKQLPD
jgi:transcriptional regulator with XRE-family HTH domain